MLIRREDVCVCFPEAERLTLAEKGANQKDHKMHFWGLSGSLDVSPASSARRLAPPIGCLGTLENGSF